MTRHERTGFKTRKATNLSLDSALVEDARALGINLSRACEEGLRKEIPVERTRRWQEENAEAIAAWNSYDSEHGSPVDQYRAF